MDQKTLTIGLVAILALMDWDLLTSLVSRAPTQATLEAVDWKLLKKEQDKQKQTNPSKCFSGTKEAIAGTANCFGTGLVETIFIGYVSTNQSTIPLSVNISLTLSFRTGTMTCLSLYAI